MADLQSESIENTKIKVRWEEPYASEGMNRAQALMPRGVYRGFVARESVTPNKYFRLMVDPTGGGINPDGVFAYWDRTDGYGLVVREYIDIGFDMSARFTAAGGTEIPPGGEIWWVWADVSYSVSTQTSGTIHVTIDGDPSLHDDAIIMAKITMLAGDTSIQNSNIDTSVMTVPYPTKREAGAYVAGDQYYGFLSGEESWKIPSYDQKKAMNNAHSPGAGNPFATETETLYKKVGEHIMYPHVGLSSATKVRVEGGNFYIGKDGVGTANAYFSLRAYNDIATPLKLGTGALVYVSAVYDSTDDHELNPSTEADADGFYANPWLYLNVAWTGDLTVLCTFEASFTNIDPKAYALGMSFLKEHTDRIFGKAVTDSPDSLTAGTLSEQLVELLGHINDRLELSGGTLSGALNVNADLGVTGDVNVSTGDVNLDGLSKIQGDDPTPSSSTEVLALFESGNLGSGRKARILCGSAGGYYGFWLTYNARWDASTDRFYPDYSAAEMYAICLNAWGIHHCHAPGGTTYVAGGGDPQAWPFCETMLAEFGLNVTARGRVYSTDLAETLYLIGNCHNPTSGTSDGYIAVGGTFFRYWQTTPTSYTASIGHSYEFGGLYPSGDRFVDQVYYEHEGFGIEWVYNNVPSHDGAELRGTVTVFS